MVDSMLDKVSLKRNEITIAQWANGEWGAIADPMSNCIFRFLKYDYTDKLYKVYSGQDEQQPILCCGFIGWLLHYRGKAVLDIFKEYYEAKKQGYIKQHEKDVDAWERNLEQEYKCIHMEDEAKYINASNVLYQYLPQCDRDYIVKMCENYIRFVQKQNDENKKHLTDSEANKPSKQPRAIKEEELKKCFNAVFKGGGRNVDYFSNLTDSLRQERSNKEFAIIAYMIYESNYLAIKSSTFRGWYKLFCEYVGCKYINSYKPSMLVPAESIRKEFYFLCRK